MKFKLETIIFTLLIIITLITMIWSMMIPLSKTDPNIEMKYVITHKELQKFKSAVVDYYCEKGYFPIDLNELNPESINSLSLDPWGNKYLITSLGWRKKGSGIDILSMGRDGKIGGKSWKRDVIIRIDLTRSFCFK